jgi:DNA-binding NarL/FixJ family response regulator
VRKLRIVVADDHKMLRESLRGMLGTQADMEVVAEADNGRTAITLTQDLQPDIVIMDVSMPGMNGLEATERLTEQCPSSRVVILTRHSEAAYVQPLLQGGASGLVLKQSTSDELLRAIRLVATGKTFIDSGLTRRLVARMKRRTESRAAASKRATREDAEPWGGLLARAGPRDHIVQLYQDQQFLIRAVSRFAASAIANGEGVILVPTAAHWEAFRPCLEADGVDTRAALERGQLTVHDADAFLPRFMRGAMPEAPVFLALAAEVIAAARGGGRYPKVRWWGEMVNILWERGDVAGSMKLEDQFDRLAHEHEIAIFCSFVMDNFSGAVHSRMLPRLGHNHSHLIPVEDYARLERAVAGALRETMGEGSALVIEEELLARAPAPFHMPRSQALLLGLRDMLPVLADSVLTRSSHLYQAAVD